MRPPPSDPSGAPLREILQHLFLRPEHAHLHQFRGELRRLLADRHLVRLHTFRSQRVRLGAAGGRRRCRSRRRGRRIRRGLRRFRLENHCIPN